MPTTSGALPLVLRAGSAPLMILMAKCLRVMLWLPLGVRTVLPES
jgi:hypothetical protein